MSVTVTHFEKQLCMTSLAVKRTTITEKHYFDVSEKERWAAFVLPVSGNLQLKSGGTVLNVLPGELCFIPEGTEYRSVWTGTPDISFFTLDIVSRKLDAQPSERFSLQKVAVPPEETRALFEEIYALFETGIRTERIRATGLYFMFYAKILPTLAVEKSVPLHPALSAAIAFLEAHYAESFDLSLLSRVACVSESRLFHLFQKYLHTTPVRMRNELRVTAASRALRNSRRPIEEIAEETGFHTAVYFRETFKSFTGVTPTEYRRNLALAAQTNTEK